MRRQQTEVQLLMGNAPVRRDGERKHRIVSDCLVSLHDFCINYLQCSSKSFDIEHRCYWLSPLKARAAAQKGASFSAALPDFSDALNQQITQRPELIDVEQVPSIVAEYQSERTGTKRKPTLVNVSAHIASASPSDLPPIPDWQYEQHEQYEKPELYLQQITGRDLTPITANKLSALHDFCIEKLELQPNSDFDPDNYCYLLPRLKVTEAMNYGVSVYAYPPNFDRFIDVEVKRSPELINMQYLQARADGKTTENHERSKRPWYRSLL